MEEDNEKDLLKILVFLADENMMPARTFDILLSELDLWDRYYAEYFEPSPDFEGGWQRVYPKIDLVHCG